MHIDRDIKLDFKDVLIRPKRSALPSRAEVDITREFIFKHSGMRYRGVPIIAANMDTVGTFEMARALAPFGLSTALHKHYGGGELVAFFKALRLKSNAFYSLGISKSDLDKFERVMQRLTELPEDERLAIHAFYFEEQNARQAAERLDISRSGFYALIARALAHLATRPQSAEPQNKAIT